MTEKSASVQWAGAGKKGLGKISTETVALMDYPCGFASRLQEIALAAKRECPLSKALAAVTEISLQATLERGAA